MIFSIRKIKIIYAITNTEGGWFGFLNATGHTDMARNRLRMAQDASEHAGRAA